MEDLINETSAIASDVDMPAPPMRARRALLKRLADVVCLPSSRVNAFERAVTGDLLVEMLREADREDRARVARRLSALSEIPTILSRLLLRDEVDVARELLEHSLSLSDCALIDCIRHGGIEHRRLVAARRPLSEVVCEALADAAEPVVIEVLLKNPESVLSTSAVETIVALSRDNERFIAPLLRRPELRPSSAYAVFWWADHDCRRTILQRFAVSREVMQEAAGDVFSIASEEGWQDPLARKALQFIERRQRNRAAIEKSPFDSLESAIAASAGGMDPELSEEISYLAGLKPVTGAKIFSDTSGEPLAILCKATGLKRNYIDILWHALRRPMTNEEGEIAPSLERVHQTYNMLAVDRAQTVLRYWNWSLSSAMTPALMQALRDGDDSGLDEYSVPQRTAMLALGKEFGRA